MDDISRRTFARQTLGSLMTYSLLELIARNDAFGAEVKPVTRKWLADVDELAREVQNKKLRQVEWQSKIEELYSKVDLPDLLRTIDFESLIKGADLPDRGARSLRPKFPQVEGLPTKFAFGSQVFALKQGRSVVPHGHDNMATAFLILQGEFHGRHYDRLEDTGNDVIIKPTIDKKFTAGGCSTVSDDKDNVHWFEALSKTAFIFNIHVYHVNPKADPSPGRIYLDVNGEKLSGGRIRARRIEHDEAEKLYG